MSLENEIVKINGDTQAGKSGPDQDFPGLSISPQDKDAPDGQPAQETCADGDRCTETPERRHRQDGEAAGHFLKAEEGQQHEEHNKKVLVEERILPYTPESKRKNEVCNRDQQEQGETIPRPREQKSEEPQVCHGESD